MLGWASLAMQNNALLSCHGVGTIDDGSSMPPPHPPDKLTQDQPTSTSSEQPNSVSRSELHGQLLKSYEGMIEMIETSTSPNEVDEDTSILFHSKVTRNEVIDVKFKEQIESLVIKRQLKDDYFTLLPFDVFQKLCRFLNYETLMNSRLVCKPWNSCVSASANFLSRTTFCLNSSELSLVNVCKTTQVKWKNVKCSFIPCLEADSAKGYQKQYFVSKLKPNSSSFLLTSITTIILHAFEIPKLNFIKWLSSCENLKSLEMIKCSFIMSTTSWTKDTLERAAANLKSVSIVNMALSSIVDFGMLILIHTKRLYVLKVYQRGLESSKGESESTRLRIKTLEDGVLNMLNLTLTKNKRSLRNVHYTFETFQNSNVHLKILADVGHLGLDLQTFSFILSNQTEVQLETFPDFLKDMKQYVRNLLISSPEIQSLRVPVMSLDFADIHDLVWDFPTTLKSVEAQLVTPFKMTSLSPNLLRERCVLKSLTLRGRVLQDDSEWSDLYKCIPWLTKLHIYCPDVSDRVVQSIIKHFPGLTELQLKAVKDLSDFGVTGKYQADTSKGLNKSGLGHGKCFQDLPELTILAIHGDHHLTDFALQFGFNSTKLESLSLTGSQLDITPEGLLSLANNCPELQTLILQVKPQQTSATNPEATVEQYTNLLKTKLPRLRIKATRSVFK